MNPIKKGSVIAAVSSEAEIAAACASPVETMFILKASILSIIKTSRFVRDHKKNLFIHLDRVDGLNGDAAALEFIKKLGDVGIITTKSSVIRSAKNLQIPCIQRIFVVDSHSEQTAVENIETVAPDLIEVMPGIIPKAIRTLKRNIAVPLICGGLIETAEEAKEALEAGALAISTGKQHLWNGVKKSHEESF